MENTNTNQKNLHPQGLNKTCTKCKNEFPATLEFFYKNKGGKYGLTPRCKTCVNEDNKLSHEKRMQKDPDRVRALANARTKKHYHNNLEEKRKYSREKAKEYRSDPDKAARIKARKRADGAGLTVEEIEAIRTKQNNKCAICGTPDPTDLDHCHKTNKVRWLLCKHCNRGLGAFFDNPSLLRKAAAILEGENDGS